jgi:phenylacetate-CoA ligase
MLLKSNIDGVVWPALPAPQGAALASLMFQFEESQFYAPEQILRQQCLQLRALLTHAATSVPFYAERMAKAGFDPKGEVTLETFRRIPILTRSEVQQAGPNTLAKTYPSTHGTAAEVKTSGTTGRPVVVRKTGLTQLMFMACELRAHRWHGRDMGGKLAVIRWMDKSQAPAPHGWSGPSWGPPADLLYRATGPAAALNIASRLEEQAAWLLREDPDYLLSYPSNILALAEYFERNGYSLSRLQQVCTVSEVVTKHMRETCRGIWNVPVTDQYSCEEAGQLAIQCPEHPHYHVQSENVLLEVVDEDGVPCPPGKSGRVLVTTLHNFASPLIRYDVGDYAEFGTSCPCGRGLPVISRILGRQRNRLVLPNGRSEFPYFGEHKDYLAITDAVLQFQFVQHSVEEIEVKLVVSKPLTHDQEERMKQLLLRSLGHPFRVTLTYHDEIPRSPSGKFEEFVCAVKPAADIQLSVGVGNG